jgi:hypothetical protein
MNAMSRLEGLETMASFVERRQHSHHLGRDLVVLASDEAYPVRDVSPGGLSLQGKPFALGDTVTVTLTSLSDKGEQIEASCRVVAISTTTTHLAFTSVTMTLLTYIVQHIGTVLGVDPYYFGKKQDAPVFA